MNSHDFLRIVDQAFAPFLRVLGFLAETPMIYGRLFEATFTGPHHVVSVTFESGDDFQAIYIFTRKGAGRSSIDSPTETPRLPDLNRRYMALVTEAEHAANQTFFCGVRPQDDTERALLKAAKDLRPVLPRYLRESQ